MQAQVVIHRIISAYTALRIVTATITNVRPERIPNERKRQIKAIKAAADAVKGTVDGTLDEAQAADPIGTLDALVYGDRTRWIAQRPVLLRKSSNND